MRRIVLFLALISLIQIHPIYASEKDTPVTATVTVSSIFNMSLDSTMIDFGTVEPGSASQRKSLTISCLTNNNKPWVISMNSQGPLSYDRYEIPNSNFKWEAALRRGSGTVTSSGEMDTTPRNIYLAGMVDYITEEPVDVTLSMYVNVPHGQVAGQYRTIVTLTMYEQ